MKKFEYFTNDHYFKPPYTWELESEGWELVAVVPYKDNGGRYFRAYYKREVIE